MTGSGCAQSEAGERADELLLLQPREISHLRLAPREHSRLQPAHSQAHAQAHAEALTQAQAQAPAHVQGLVQARTQALAPAFASAQSPGPGLPLRDLPTSVVPLRVLGDERAPLAQTQRPGHGLAHPSRLQLHAFAASNDCGSDAMGDTISVAARARASRSNATAQGAAPAASEVDGAACGVSWAANLERSPDAGALARAPPGAGAGPAELGDAAQAQGRVPQRSLAGIAERGHDARSQEQGETAMGERTALLTHPAASQEGAWEPPNLRAGRVLSGIAEGSQDGVSQAGSSQATPVRVSSSGKAPEGSVAPPSNSAAGLEGARAPPFGLYHSSMQAPGALGVPEGLPDAPADMQDVLGESPCMTLIAGGAAAPEGPGLGVGSRASAAPATWAPGSGCPSPPRFSAAGSGHNLGYTSGLGFDTSGRRASAAGMRASMIGRRLSGAPAQGVGPGSRGSVLDGAGGTGGGSNGGGLLRRIATVLGAGEDSAAADGAPREHEAVPRRQSVVEALLAEQLRAGKARPSSRETQLRPVICAQSCSYFARECMAACLVPPRMHVLAHAAV